MKNVVSSKSYPSLQTIFIICVIFFWGVPFFKDMLPTEEANEIVSTCLRFVNPMFCVGMSYMYFSKTKFTWFLPVGFMLIFLPLPFLFYEWKDVIYVLFYGISSLGGACIAFLVKHSHKIRR